MRVLLGTLLILLALLLGGEDWIYTRKMPPEFFPISRLLMIFSAGLFAGGVHLMEQGLVKGLSERQFKIAGTAASVFFGLALISGGILLLYLADLMMTRDTEVRPWAMTYLLTGLAGVASGVL